MVVEGEGVGVWEEVGLRAINGGAFVLDGVCLQITKVCSGEIAESSQLEIAVYI